MRSPRLGRLRPRLEGCSRRSSRRNRSILLLLVQRKWRFLLAFESRKAMLLVERLVQAYSYQVSVHGPASASEPVSAQHPAEENVTALARALAAVQARMVPASEGPYACGRALSMADMAAVPFVLRALMALEADIGKYPAGEGRRAFEAFNSDPRYARVREYVIAVKAHPTVQATWDEVSGRPHAHTKWS